MKKKIVGIDIGGTKIAVVLADETGLISKKESFSTLKWNLSIEKIIEIIESFSLPKDIVIGISCGGPLDSEKGIIQSPPNLPGWDNIPIVDIIAKATQAKTYLMNDANAGALAEWYFGSGKGFNNIIFLTIGTGMGGGLILNGKLYEGTTGDAGEIGHIRMNSNGPIGYGKVGSYEGFCSGGGIAQLGQKKAIELDGNVAFKHKTIADITAKDIADAAFQGDPIAIQIFEESAEYLGKGLSLLIDILNPEVIVLGSLFIRCEKLFTNKMNQILERECLPRNLTACKIVPAGLNENIGDMAAISVALYNTNDLAQRH